MVAKLAKICIIGLKEHQEKILEFLYQSGLTEIIKSKEGEENFSSSEVDYDLVSVKYGIQILETFKDEKKISFKDKLNNIFFSKFLISKKKTEEVAKSKNWKELLEKIQNFQIKINDLSSKIAILKQERESILPWKNLDFNFEEFKKLKFFSFWIGRILISDWEKVKKDVFKKTNLIEVKEINKDSQYIYCLFLFDKKLDKEINNLLEKYDTEKLEIKNSGSFVDNFHRLEREYEELKLENKKTINGLKKLVNQTDELKIVHDWLFWKKQKQEVKEKAIHTKFNFCTYAWIEKEKLSWLKKEINKITKEFEILEIPLKKNENSPIILKNKKFVDSFKAVTNIYGFPKSNEPDPTPFLTPFFLIFFAICLSDAGYGLIMALISGLALKFLNIPEEKKGFIRLLFWLGVATIFIGTLFGSWFGENIFNFKVIDLMNDPVFFLILSLAFGVFQNIVGLAINMYWKIKDNMVIDGILDNLPWGLTLTGFLFLIMVNLGFLHFPLSVIKYFVFGGLILVVLTKGRKQKNIFLKILTGIGALYGLIGYFSNILSYSRLLALGLATAIIAMTINLLAGIFSDMIPVVGTIIGVVILIGGHLFSLVINALGAFIHSTRLQCVEFFPSFMEGGGRRFISFKREGKYIHLVD